MDTFSYEVFKPEAELFQLTPQNWKQEIETMQPDMLFVESAWRGKDDLWTGKVKQCANEITGLVGYCKMRKIPTVFWNKEDPHHFDDFIGSAKLFDFVFTTDIECIPLYKKHLDHDSIFLLPFACQPKIHNPIEKYERKNAFVFAGAYYNHFPERNIQFANMINALASEGEVDIYDRNYSIKGTLLKFPKEYHQFIRGGLDYDEIDKAHKGYKYATNLNSITESPTMFSRRVFELMASNTIVLSNYTIGTQVLLGDLVISTDDTEELKEKVRQMEQEPLFEKKIRLAALRKVMLEHTSRDRMNEMVSKVFSCSAEVYLPHITCISYAKEQKQIQGICEVFLTQNYQNKSMLIVCADGVFPDFEEDENISYIIESDHQKAADYYSDANYLAGLCTDDYYGKNYLMDLALATRYSDAKIITKGGCYAYNDQNGLQLKDNTRPYKSETSAAARSSILCISKVSQFGIIDFAKALDTEHHIKESVFSIDEFNYCRNGAGKRLGTEEKVIIDDLQNIDTGISIDDKWIEKQLRIIERRMIKKEKLVNLYKQKETDSKKQNARIKKQKEVIEKYKTMIENRNREIKESEDIIKTKTIEIIKQTDKLNAIKKAKTEMLKIKALRHPGHKYRAYKNLVREINKTI